MNASSRLSQPGRRWRDIRVSLGQPGVMPWLAVGIILLAALLMPPSPVGRLCAFASLTTAIVLLAVARSWRNQRWLSEGILLCSTLVAVGLGIAKAPASLQVGAAPVILIFASLGILTWSEWRFAPDFGQTGVYWAVIGGIRGALWAGLGLGIAMVLRTAFQLPTGLTTTLVYVGGAAIGRWCGSLLMPARYPLTGHPAAPHAPSDLRPRDPADWWKHG
ncbi:MAG TPA: hypothetical protein PLF88_08540 [Opitutaceae bacterium]|nr:hypothetical protein [Opitutaceae bacterium]HRJ48576.1 hypothetical protein [Opitutaceae bacterium]